MFYFCQHCGNMLTLENSIYGYRFSCPTCPFVFHIQKKLSSRWYPKLKQIDEILSDSEMWKNVDSTDEKCPKCKFCCYSPTFCCPHRLRFLESKSPDTATCDRKIIKIRAVELIAFRPPPNQASIRGPISCRYKPDPPMSR